MDKLGYFLPKRLSDTVNNCSSSQKFVTLTRIIFVELKFNNGSFVVRRVCTRTSKRKRKFYLFWYCVLFVPWIRKHANSVVKSWLLLLCPEDKRYEIKCRDTISRQTNSQINVIEMWHAYCIVYSMLRWTNNLENAVVTFLIESHRLHRNENWWVSSKQKYLWMLYAYTLRFYCVYGMCGRRTLGKQDLLSAEWRQTAKSAFTIVA